MLGPRAFLGSTEVNIKITASQPLVTEVKGLFEVNPLEITFCDKLQFEL